MLIVKMYIIIKKSCIIYVVNKQFESGMTLWDVNGITLKKKRPKRIKIQVE